MNIKKTLFAAVLALTSMSVSAQETTVENVFNPHWYVQVQGGAQYTLGEIDFGSLVSPNAQVGVGYNFTPVLGARLAINAWQSKAGSTLYMKDYKWDWKYVSPNVDLTVNLSNLLCGYNPNRVFNFGVYGGIGANIAFSNDKAQEVSRQMITDNYKVVTQNDQFLRYLWDGSKPRLNAQFGATADVRLTEKLSLGLEVQANTVGDHYNSKKAGNTDWYFNGLVGVKYNLGKTHSTRQVKGCDPVIEYRDRVVEKIVEKEVIKEVEKPVAAAKVETVEPLKETIFYAICISDPDADSILDKVVAWCNKYPSKGITVSGYADKGTGNASGNVVYAQKRAEKVAKKLQAKGIAASRMTVNSYGDKVQPFAENDKNRCVIIVGE